MGSGGDYLRNAYKKHGEENFVKHILYVYDNFKDMNYLEMVLVGWKEVWDENCYNMTPGGRGFNSHTAKEQALKFWHDSEYEESRKNRSQKMLGNQNNFSFKGQDVWNKGKTGVYSEETLKAKSESQKGNEPWNKGLTDVYSEETKEMMSEAKKGVSQRREVCSHCEKDFSVSIIQKHIQRCKENPERKPLILTCPYCCKSSEESLSFRKNHFDNCRENPNLEKIECPHCGLFDNPNRSNFLRYHFENCKQKEGPKPL
jgi:hypothetical protein